MIAIGIDPGLDGALALVRPGRVLSVADAPTLRTRRGKRHVRDYVLPAMLELLDQALAEVLVGDIPVGIEGQHAFPGQGVTSMFSLGRGLGLWEMAAVSRGASYRLVPPGVWKRPLGLRGADKGASIVRALQLYPEADLRLKRHHGRADAILIAHYTMTRLQSPETLAGAPQRAG